MAGFSGRKPLSNLIHFLHKNIIPIRLFHLNTLNFQFIFSLFSIDFHLFSFIFNWFSNYFNLFSIDFQLIFNLFSIYFQFIFNLFSIYFQFISDLFVFFLFFPQALSAVDESDWALAASYSNSAYLTCMDLHTYFFAHVHDLVVTAATTSIDSHNNSIIRDHVFKNTVQEIDLDDQDSFAYFYTKFLFVCAFFFLSCFNGVKAVVKYYKNRKILKY